METNMHQPMKHRHTFKKVLWNCEDQVVVRKLLEELVPPKVQAEIVRRFNMHCDERNQAMMTIWPELATDKDWQERLSRVGDGFICVGDLVQNKDKDGGYFIAMEPIVENGEPSWRLKAEHSGRREWEYERYLKVVQD